MFDFDELDFDSMEKSSLNQPSNQAWQHKKQSPVAFDIPIHDPNLARGHGVSLAQDRLMKYDDRKSPQTNQEEAYRQIRQKVEERLFHRKEKARLHNSKVAERVLDIQQRRQEWANAKKILEESFREKCQKAEAQLTERKQKAAEHNDKVAERARIANFKKWKQLWQERPCDIKQRLEQPEGSQIQNELFSHVQHWFVAPSVGTWLSPAAACELQSKEGSKCKSASGTRTASLTEIVAESQVEICSITCSLHLPLPEAEEKSIAVDVPEVPICSTPDSCEIFTLPKQRNDFKEKAPQQKKEHARCARDVHNQEEEDFTQQHEKAKVQSHTHNASARPKDKACQNSESITESVQDIHQREEPAKLKKQLKQGFTQKLQKAKMQSQVHYVRTRPEEEACQHSERVTDSVRQQQKEQAKSKKLLDKDITRKTQKAKAQSHAHNVPTRRKEEACQCSGKVTETMQDSQQRQEHANTKKQLEQDFTQKPPKAKADCHTHYVLTRPKEKICRRSERITISVQDVQQREEWAKSKKEMEQDFTSKLQKAKAQSHYYYSPTRPQEEACQRSFEVLIEENAIQPGVDLYGMCHSICASPMHVVKVIDECQKALNGSDARRRACVSLGMRSVC